MFDAQQYLDALEKPTFKAPDGTIYIGRILSVNEFLPYAKAMREASSSEKPDALKAQVAMVGMVNAMFPVPWYKRLFTRSVLSWLQALPPKIQMQAIWSFSVLQAKALGIELIPPTGVAELLK